VLPKHCLTYFLLLSFAPILIYALIANLSSLAYAQQTHQTVARSYNGLYTFNNKLYLAKTFLWNGSNSFVASYNLTNELSTLMDLLTSPMKYDIFNNNESNLIYPSPNASNNSKVSEYTYSLRVLEGEMVSVLKCLV